MMESISVVFVPPWRTSHVSLASIPNFVGAKTARKKTRFAANGEAGYSSS